MNLVIDTSAVLAVLLNETHKPGLVRATRHAELIAPQSMHWEVGNALSAMLRRKRIDFEQVLAALKSYGSIPVQFVRPTLEKGLSIAYEHRIYAYDAYMIACAQRHNCRLLTLDKGLKQVALKEGVQVMEVPQ